MQATHQARHLQRRLQRVVQLRLLVGLLLRPRLRQSPGFRQAHLLSLLRHPQLRAGRFVLDPQFVQRGLQRLAVALAERTVLLTRQVRLDVRQGLSKGPGVPLASQVARAHEPRLQARQDVALDVLLRQTRHLVDDVRPVRIHQLPDAGRVDTRRRQSRRLLRAAQVVLV